jgi:outer membrane protein assembly factor BamB
MNKAGVTNGKFIAGLVITLIVVTSIAVLASLHASPQPSSSITVNPSSSNWPMFRHDLSHAGYSASTAPTSPNLLWNYTTTTEFNFPENEGRDPLTTSPVVAEGYLYCSGAINVYCLNASSGEQVWIYPTSGLDSSTPAVAGGYVYVGVAALLNDIPSNPTVVCLDALTGSKVWNFATSGPVSSSPAVANGYLYVQCTDGNLYCLDALTGNKKWSCQLYGVGRSSPAVVDGFIYVGSGDGNVNCIDAGTGEIRWQYMTGGDKPWEAHAVLSSPSVVDGRVYVGSHDFNVYCLNASNGEKLWNYTTGFYVESSPAVASGYVYVGATDENVYCLDAYSGEKVWNFLATAENVTRFRVQSSPAVANGHVYFGANNYVYCLDGLTGDKVWEYAGNGIIGHNSPAIADGVMYITTEGGYVYAFE